MILNWATMERQSDFIYQTLWKDCKHCHLLDLTPRETQSLGIRCTFSLKSLMDFLGFRWAVTVTTTQTEAERPEDVNWEPGVLLECAWMPDLAQWESKPSQHETPSACCLHLFGSFFYQDPHPHFIRPAGCATKTASSSSKWFSDPHLLCSADFPTTGRHFHSLRLK